MVTRQSKWICAQREILVISNVQQHVVYVVYLTPQSFDHGRSKVTGTAGKWLVLNNMNVPLHARVVGGASYM